MQQGQVQVWELKLLQNVIGNGFCSFLAIWD